MSAVAKSSLTLTEADVKHLLEDTSAQGRADISGKIAATYAGAVLDTKERQIAEQIFRLLIRDTEVKVRATLAGHIKESTQIPRDIVMSMASDVAEVSSPILEYSEVLSDQDLLDIIHSTEDISRYVAISKRKTVSESVTDSLVHKGNDEVVGTLLNNTGANISDIVFDRIVDEYKENESLMQAVTSRPQLPPATVEKMMSVVSEGIADTLKKKYKVAGEQIQKEVDKSRETETLNLVRAAKSHDDVEKLITQMQDSDRLTPSMILSALCQGNFDFFESSLAKLSSIPVENARTLIADRGELGFRAIYNKSGLPDAMFPAVKLLLKIVREMDAEGNKATGASYANRIVERILHYSEENPIENLSYIIALVRRVAQ